MAVKPKVRVKKVQDQDQRTKERQADKRPKHIVSCPCLDQDKDNEWSKSHHKVAVDSFGTVANGVVTGTGMCPPAVFRLFAIWMVLSARGAAAFARPKLTNTQLREQVHRVVDECINASLELDVLEEVDMGDGKSAMSFGDLNKAAARAYASMSGKRAEDLNPQDLVDILTNFQGPKQ